MFDCLLPEVLAVPAAAVSSQSGVSDFSSLLPLQLNAAADDDKSVEDMNKPILHLEQDLFSISVQKQVRGDYFKGRIIDINGGEHISNKACVLS